MNSLSNPSRCAQVDVSAHSRSLFVDGPDSSDKQAWLSYIFDSFAIDAGDSCLGLCHIGYSNFCHTGCTTDIPIKFDTSLIVSKVRIILFSDLLKKFKVNQKMFG